MGIESQPSSCGSELDDGTVKPPIHIFGFLREFRIDLSRQKAVSWSGRTADIDVAVPVRLHSVNGRVHIHDTIILHAPVHPDPADLACMVFMRISRMDYI